MWTLKNWVSYPKHLAKKGRAWDDVVKSTTSGPAKYARNVNVRLLETAVIEHGIRFAEDGGIRFYYHEFETVIGASRGTETKYAVVQWDADPLGSYHGHPISRDELIDELRKCKPDKLQRFLKKRKLQIRTR